MARVEDVGERDGWRCWLCDEAVDPMMSVNDPRGPSMDSGPTAVKRAKGTKKGFDAGQERLAHRACNTRKGAVAPVVPWPDHLFVVDQAPIIAGVDLLQRKGGRVVMGRCPTSEDGQQAADWLRDRVSRLRPGLEVDAAVEPGGGEYLLVLRA
jgi:hypothetical protein